jgi:hypothetical protein
MKIFLYKCIHVYTYTYINTHINVYTSGIFIYKDTCKPRVGAFGEPSILSPPSFPEDV